MLIEFGETDINPVEFTISADTDTTFLLSNLTGEPKTFFIEDAPVTQEVPAGETVSIVVNAPAGEYVYGLVEEEALTGVLHVAEPTPQEGTPPLGSQRYGLRGCRVGRSPADPARVAGELPIAGRLGRPVEVVNDVLPRLRDACNGCIVLSSPIPANPGRHHNRGLAEAQAHKSDAVGHQRAPSCGTRSCCKRHAPLRSPALLDQPARRPI